MNPVRLASVVRGDLVESVHAASVVAVDDRGTVLLEAGDVRAPMWPRSAVKPLQALAMVRAGLSVEGPLLALACASHVGAPFHRDGAARMLTGAGLGEEHLDNTPMAPLGERYGHVASRLAANCSGKHAAMLATCVANGWPTSGYRDPGHPLQRHVAAVLAEATGEPIAATTVDGCGAPLFGVSLLGLATAFARLAGGEDEPSRRVVRAMRENPEWVAGDGRLTTRWMRAVPRGIAKDGAEGVFAFAVPGGPAVAVKIADGSARALPVVAVEAARVLGLARDSAVASSLAEIGDVPVLGGGQPVGVVRADPLADHRR